MPTPTPYLWFSNQGQGISSDDRTQAKHGHREVPASKRFNPLLKQKFTLRGTEETEDFPTKSELCFQQLAKAYGVPSVQLFRLDEDLDATLQRVLYCQEPALLHARIDSHCALTPQVARDETLDVM